ncbi:hypothetical protein CCAND95_130012 [Capnocytophaga canis]|uniref:Uncharacterized protein n=1 Tax=Capnocytophaga canis TaxID=1848903 RepID=A0A0B7HTI7_9FLAO|nr:hypothetical protein CCAND95_130012 [Capnocytophaga canis]CEN43872.1 hypothetical protein CCAND38_140013 [Capnocytophaga canis]CEN54075.1 hypothetical protein CCAND93_70011 [Capnocytophaga canis]
MMVSAEDSDFRELSVLWAVFGQQRDENQTKTKYVESL